MRTCMAVLLVVLLGGRIEAAPATRPAELVATVSVGPSALAGVRAYANAVSPGSGASIDPQLVLLLSGASSKGLDLAAPMHLVVGKTGGRPGFVAVAKV